MVTLAELTSLLQGGGSAASIALLYVAWRLDRRIVRIETKLETVKRNVVDE